MPKHYAMGVNIKKGTTSFLASKTQNVSFPTPFSAIPAISLALDSIQVAPPYRINVTTIGFTIKFQINYTGDVDWIATL